MIVGNCATAGSCIYPSWCSALPGHGDSATTPALCSAPQLTMLLPHSAAAGSACSELPTSALCTRFLGRRGMLRLLWSQGVADGSRMSCHEHRGTRCHRCDESCHPFQPWGRLLMQKHLGHLKIEDI